MFFSVITKNLNQEILTRNLVTFKRSDGVKVEKLLIFWGFTEKSDFQGGGHEKPIQRGGLPKKVGLDILPI